MTQNYAVEQKRTSPLPAIIVGTGAGALAGWGASNIGPLKKARYSSFQDIINESKDSFQSLGESVKDNESLKKSYDAIATKKKEYYNKFKELAKDVKFDEKIKAEGEAAATKSEDLRRVTQDFLARIKNGELGFDKTKIEPEKLEEAAKKYLKENKDKAEFKEFKDALTAFDNRC